MGFWIFMTISDLLIPIIMIVFGARFRRKPPKSISTALGYRTTRSMKNRQTWAFAHRHFGAVWLVTGIILTLISAIYMLPLLGKPESQISIYGLILCGIQLIVLLGSLFPTELALKKRFDK